jgi:hypothetical protein
MHEEPTSTPEPEEPEEELNLEDKELMQPDNDPPLDVGDSSLEVECLFNTY